MMKFGNDVEDRSKRCEPEDVECRIDSGSERMKIHGKYKYKYTATECNMTCRNKCGRVVKTTRFQQQFPDKRTPNSCQAKLDVFYSESIKLKTVCPRRAGDAMTCKLTLQYSTEYSVSTVKYRGRCVTV